MKKFVKGLLFGAGIAAVGLAVYSLWKDAIEPVAVWDSDALPSPTPSKEYVERRKQQMRTVAEAQKAAQEKSVQKETAPEEAPDAIPVEPVPSEQATEQQEQRL